MEVINPASNPQVVPPPPARTTDEADDERGDEPDTLSEFERIDRHSGGRLNRQFMDDARAHIAQTPDHPLRKLLDENGNWHGRTHLSEEPTVQAGHLASRHAGVEERFALEDSYYNQQTSWVAESKGAIVVKPAIDIGGVAVERRTAEMWARTGILDPAVLAQASAHAGWAGS